METPIKTKLLFWIIIGFFSVFFAEYVSGSAPLSYVNLWGWLVVFPLYTLHCIILITIIYRFGKPTLPTLFFAGAIFGLYEAYITKVLWNPHWNLDAIRFGGVAVFETIVLVLFWHVFFSFIIPIFISENMFTKSRNILILLPQKFQKYFVDSRKYKHFLFWFFVVAGVVLGGQIKNPVVIIGSLTSALVFYIVLRKLWFRKERNYKFEELLPNKKQFRVLVILLLVYYVFLSIISRPEFLPDLKSQFTIWLIYMLMIYLFVKSLKKSRTQIFVSKNLAIKYSQHEFVHYFILLTLFSLLGAFLSINMPFFTTIIIWLVGGLFGIWIFFESVEDVFRD